VWDNRTKKVKQQNQENDVTDEGKVTGRKECKNRAHIIVHFSCGIALVSANVGFVDPIK